MMIFSHESVLQARESYGRGLLCGDATYTDCALVVGGKALGGTKFIQLFGTKGRSEPLELMASRGVHTALLCSLVMHMGDALC